jgi:hypothetical protein
VDAATVMAADSVMVVVPLNADTVVPDVMPAPEIRQPTQGGVVGVPVKVKVVEDPDVEPTPEPCDVNKKALPARTRNSTGPLPRSNTALGLTASGN